MLIWLILSFIAILIIILLPTMFYIVKQWETATLIRFGRIVKTVTGGLHIKMPFIDSVIRLDMRVQTFDLRGQSAITKDNISVKIDSVGFLKIEDARKLILGVEDYWSAIRSYSQTSLRNIVGEYSLDELLEKREAIAEKMKKIVDSYTKEWGVDIQ
ncbi:slipin family protein, partial [Candidatus Bathyarchaeota archaeon]